MKAHPVTCGFKMSVTCAHSWSSIRFTDAKENTIADGEWLETPHQQPSYKVLSHSIPTNVMTAASGRGQLSVDR